MLGDDHEPMEVALPVPLPLRCGLETRSPDIATEQDSEGAVIMTIGDAPWPVRAFDRRRAMSIMLELTPLLTIGLERGNSFALYDHTFFMWWRSFFHEDRDLCRRLVECAAHVGPRPPWEVALEGELEAAARALSLKVDLRLLTVWGDVGEATTYRDARARPVAARLELSASSRVFVIEAELARAVPTQVFAATPTLRKPTLLALSGRHGVGAPERRRFSLQSQSATVPPLALAVESALHALPSEVSSCELGRAVRVSVHDLDAVASVEALIHATVHLATALDAA